MRSNNSNTIIFLTAFTALSILLRLLPHLPNFAPIGALAIFTGIYAKRRFEFVAPIIAVFISDIFIGFYDIGTMAVVYFSYLVAITIGRFVKNSKNFSTIFAGTLAGSLVFYISTNFAVWAFSKMYPHTLAGLMSSYTMALPFFRSSLLGDLVYTAIFVGSYELIVYLLGSPKLRYIKIPRRLGAPAVSR